MGLDISFTYDGDAPESLPGPALRTYLIDLFEAPDALLETGAFGNTAEDLELAGLLPSFVKAHRKVFTSSGEWTGNLTGENDICHEEEKADIVFAPSEAIAWSDIWLTLLDDDEIREDDELRQSLLPITHESLEQIVQDLQTLAHQAQSAHQSGLSLRMISQWD